MRITTIVLATIAAFPIAAAATSASAQDREAAMHRCLQMAQEQFPGTDATVDRNRTSVYKSCMTRAGFTP